MGPHYDSNFQNRFGPLSGTTLLTDLDDPRIRPVPPGRKGRRTTAVLIFVAMMAGVATQLPDAGPAVTSPDHSSRP